MGPGWISSVLGPILPCNRDVSRVALNATYRYVWLERRRGARTVILRCTCTVRPDFMVVPRRLIYFNQIIHLVQRFRLPMQRPTQKRNRQIMFRYNDSFTTCRTYGHKEIGSFGEPVVLSVHFKNVIIASSVQSRVSNMTVPEKVGTRVPVVTWSRRMLFRMGMKFARSVISSICSMHAHTDTQDDASLWYQRYQQCRER